MNMSHRTLEKRSTVTYKLITIKFKTHDIAPKYKKYYLNYN